MNADQQAAEATRLAAVGDLFQRWVNQVARETQRQMEATDPIVWASASEEIREVSENSAYAGAMLMLQEFVNSELLTADQLIALARKQVQNGRS